MQADCDIETIEEYCVLSSLSRTIHKHITQTVLIFNSIPILYKYMIPCIIMITNILQLNKIGLINSYDLAMDPGNIFDTADVQWWRLLSYVVAIDSGGTGVRDILGNLVGLIICGFFLGKRFTINQKSLSRDYFNNRQMQISGQTVQQENTVSENQNLSNLTRRIHGFWSQAIFIESIIISIWLSIVNCFVWFIWTRFGPHTFVSIGLIPLFYYHFMRLIFVEKDCYNFQLSFLPFKMKNKYLGLIVGLILMICSMESQSIFIVMLNFFIFK